MRHNRAHAGSCTVGHAGKRGGTLEMVLGRETSPENAADLFNAAATLVQDQHSRLNDDEASSAATLILNKTAV